MDHVRLVAVGADFERQSELTVCFMAIFVVGGGRLKDPPVSLVSRALNLVDGVSIGIDFLERWALS